MDELVAIAVIKRAIGLDGSCGVSPHGETFARLKAPAGVCVGDDARSARECVIEKISQRPRGFVAQFDCAKDRTAAEKLLGQTVFLREEDLPELDDGAYYHFHLKGMNVLSESTGAKIGAVKDTLNLPSTDALEVALDNGKEVVIPYNDHAVVSVDIDKKVIVINDDFVEELLY